MRVTVNDKMKEWVAAYIRTHRAEGCISIHVVFSKFNEDFKTTFNADPRMIVNLLIQEGFLKGKPAKNGFSIWLPEDAGKGQKRSSHVRLPAAVDVQDEEAVAAPTQNGENEMKMIEVKIETNHSFEWLPHPETGAVDILELLRYIMQKLSARLPNKPDMDGGYAVVKMSLFASLVEIGIPREKCDGISRILQEMALVKKYPKSQWGILHTKAAGYFVTPSLYNIAKEAMIWRDQRNSEIAKLRLKVQERPAVEVQPVQVRSSSTSFEAEAIEALAEAERLSEELAKIRARVQEVEVERDQLKRELDSRPDEAEVVKLAFHERLAALKQVTR